MRWKRILGLAVVFFFFFMIEMVTQEVIWYRQHPLEALGTMIHELSNPIIAFSLTLWNLFFGFITDLVLSFLEENRRLRKQKAE